jgi:murein DD-endopeptidase MepM/ murein hydrolase activator NlpD
VVVTAECNAAPTHGCDVDGSPAITGCGWYVEIRHAGDLVTVYCHLLRRPLVNVGQTVTAGQVIGNVGMSGNASAPHLHFEVHNGYPATRLNAIDPVPFMAAHAVALR